MYRLTDYENTGRLLNMADAEVRRFPTFFSAEEADRYLTVLSETVFWRQDNMNLYGRSICQPSLTAWFGDAGASYTYSGITMNPEPWTPELLQIRKRIEPVAGVTFNSVLLRDDDAR